MVYHTGRNPVSEQDYPVIDYLTIRRLGVRVRIYQIHSPHEPFKTSPIKTLEPNMILITKDRKKGREYNAVKGHSILLVTFEPKIGDVS